MRFGISSQVVTLSLVLGSGGLASNAAAHGHAPLASQRTQYRAALRQGTILEHARNHVDSAANRAMNSAASRNFERAAALVDGRNASARHDRATLLTRAAGLASRAGEHGRATTLRNQASRWIRNTPVPANYVPPADNETARPTSDRFAAHVRDGDVLANAALLVRSTDVRRTIYRAASTNYRSAAAMANREGRNPNADELYRRARELDSRSAMIDHHQGRRQTERREIESRAEVLTAGRPARTAN